MADTDTRWTPRLVNARSRQRFPNLGKPFCVWHTDCTAMDCENFRRIPSDAQIQASLKKRAGLGRHSK